MVVRLITEKFLSKLVVESLRAWSKQTENSYDNKVIEAMAEALGLPPDAVVVAVPAFKK